jgi:hypothetical protein
MRSLWNEANERRGMEAMRIEPMPTIHETLNKIVECSSSHEEAVSTIFVTGT